MALDDWDVVTYLFHPVMNGVQVLRVMGLIHMEDFI